jgi:hypothetical protein
MTPVPAKRPCGSCPYRCDVPSGVWDSSEYEKLPAYDAETALQPAAMFYCHQQDGRLCAGYVAVHDMDHSLALRLAAITGQLSPEEVLAVCAYSTDVPLHPSGAAAAQHGLADVESPSEEACRVVAKVERVQQQRERNSQ